MVDGAGVTSEEGFKEDEGETVGEISAVDVGVGTVELCGVVPIM